MGKTEPGGHGVHKTAQTAFRLPDDLLAWLRGQAAKEKPATMTDIVVRALEAERERCGITTRPQAREGITTSGARTRKPGAVAPSRAAHAPNCKCGICKPPKNGGTK